MYIVMCHGLYFQNKITSPSLKIVLSYQNEMPQGVVLFLIWILIACADPGIFASGGTILSNTLNNEMLKYAIY